MSSDWKIYTRTGDKGETSLIGGRRVPKYDLQIEAYGTVDELNSFIGMIHAKIAADEAGRITLLEVMDRLFTLESLLAEDKAPDPEGKRKTRPLPGLYPGDVSLLEHEIDRMNETLPALSSFILPGGTETAALCHVARCVCRRAERITLRLWEELRFDPLILQYLNRLSDYLFVLARYLNRMEGGEEVLWKAKT
ncbi:MAG TPA: cob(I)yrinic acid a,c-diamide adenosyltransferase [Bacteroidales bacterium]|nr:cob(I)yrinic acid a,c-diamide adenosyltransferase [Bacteroidales bacterium]HSA44353.1 cob(I)yrinic acid a,c-diamide adenosyltransferase [Bacteroidales bacterium]